MFHLQPNHNRTQEQNEREEFYVKNDLNAKSIGALKIELKKAGHKYNSCRIHFNLNKFTPFEYTDQILAA